MRLPLRCAGPASCSCCAEVARAGGRPLQTYAVVLTAATVVAVAVGFVSQSLDVAPDWRTAGWLVLVTVTGQLLGWMLVGRTVVLVASYAATARR
jgi:uncharacterized membrane protein